MVVASVLASFQIMASACSLRANSPFGGVARSHARAEREMRQAFSRVSLSPQASSPFMARELSHERTPLALAGPFACCSCVTFATAPNGELARGLRLALLAIIREHARRLATTATFSLLDHLIYMVRLKEIAALNFKSAKRISP